jgi:hypothetical protein
MRAAAALVTVAGLFASPVYAGGECGNAVRFDRPERDMAPWNTPVKSRLAMTHSARGCLELCLHDEDAQIEKFGSRYRTLHYQCLYKGREINATSRKIR